MFVICLPALLFSILGQLAAHDGGDFPIGDVPLALVNLEANDCRNSTPHLILGKKCIPMRPVSCRYIDNIGEVFKLVSY